MEENKISENEKEIKEKEILADNSEIKPEVNDNNLEEKLIKEINRDESHQKKRYFGIDLIRVVACFLVMQTHAGEIYYIDDNGGLIKDEKNLWPGILNSLARICVPLFIMISGYLLLPMKTDYSTFIKKRFTRISFPFIAFCIFYDIFFYIKGSIDLKNLFLNIPKIFINYGTIYGLCI